MVMRFIWAIPRWVTDGLESWLTRDGVAYGAVAGKDNRYHGQIFGCYLHGIFNNAEFCQRFFGLDDRGVDFEILAGKALDDFANYLMSVLDKDFLRGLLPHSES